MKTETLIKRAKAKLVRKLTKLGKTPEFINHALSINFPE